MEPDGSFKVGDTTYIIDASEDSNMHDSDIKPKLVCKQEKTLVEGTKSTVTSNSDKSIKVQDQTLPKHPFANFASKFSVELEKHRYNIRTIIQCSNATPIRVHNLGSGYVCCFCDATFMKAADLKKHTIMDHDDRTKRSFKSTGGLRNFLVKLDITSLCCNICNFAPANLEQLIEHLNNVHDKKLHTDVKNHIVSFKIDEDAFKCHICSTNFNSFRYLMSHMNKYFANFLCDVCGSGFVNRHQLVKHSELHQKGSHKCSTCEKIFKTERSLKTHELTHKAASAIYRCFHCGERFKNRTLKKKHMIDLHGAKYADFKCNACDKTFRNSKCLQTHKVKDHSMKRWTCKLCDKEFCMATRLRQHELIHSGVRNFTCELCSKSFARRCSLKEHLRTHSNDSQRNRK